MFKSNIVGEYGNLIISSSWQAVDKWERKGLEEISSR